MPSKSLVLRILNWAFLFAMIGWLAVVPGWDSGGGVILAIVGLIAQEQTTTKSLTRFDRVYSADNSARFYDVIAAGYDARNSDLLLETHKKVNEAIDALVSGLPTWSVLDLCGGTGKQIAFHFANCAQGHWLYVDASQGMLDQFNRNLRNLALPVETRHEDVFSFLDDLRGQNKHDVVLFALALSSLSHNPDWSKVAKLVKPGGALVIAEIEPSYATIHPFFSVLVGKKSHALMTRQVHSSDLISEITEAGLVFDPTATKLVREGGKTYSYIQVFHRT
ncbi:MAG: class I SAM-dependent methyltransferase [Coriobacteriia bacterium]|nr:class I SAM-dependent methyltransferase [Coriobacteriia bacterium]